MNHYIDISILLNAEFTTPVLMNALYSKFHKALYDLDTSSIGVSFPKHDTTLGNILRLHGTHEVLRDLQNLHWISTMSSHCVVSDILTVPKHTKFRTISRVQPTMSHSKLMRKIKRHQIPESKINEYGMHMLAKQLNNPYIELISRSNGQKHRRYITFGELSDAPVAGKFNKFGLSKTATVPWFD